MNATAIEAALRKSDPGILLIERRILRRVIKRHRHLSGLGLQVPHAHSYTLSRAALLEIATLAELGHPAAELPETIILIPRPDRERNEAAAGLLAYWRLAFHARVHQALEARYAAGELTPAVVRARVHRIGQTEFDEVRFVLRQDDLLVAPHDDREVYSEFAAVYLELSCFAPLDLGRMFPTLTDPAHVEATLALDVDAAKLFTSSRPEGVPDSALAVAREEATHPPHQEHAAAPRRSGAMRAMSGQLAAVQPEDKSPVPAVPPSGFPDVDAARARGNSVRAALLALGRARTGSDDDSRARARRAAREDLDRLVERLRVALGSGEPLPGGGAALLPLADASLAGHGVRRAVPVRLLYDLQRACVHHERDARTVGVIEWVLSLGRRPIVRSLPAGREVRVAKDVHAAAAKLSRLRVTEAAQKAASELVREAALRADELTREMVRPKLLAVLAEVGLAPANVAERVARAKLVEELLDHTVEHGFLNMGQLRDAIARNQLKLTDLRVHELWRRDALLKADQRLALTLDGVYRRGEIYLRFLQKLSSVAFGTVVGRFLSLWVILPVLSAFLILQGASHIVHPLGHMLFHVQIHLWSKWSFGAGIVVFFGLIHSSHVRRGLLYGLHLVWRLLYWLLWGGPRWLWRLGPVQVVVRSVPARFFGRFILKPLVVTGVVWVTVPIFHLSYRTGLIIAGAGFLAFNLLLNSRAGTTFEEIAADWAVRSFRDLGKRILPGLFRLIVNVFSALLELIDRMIYAVDEWLRFKQGQGKVALYVKGTLGVIWFFVTYLLRVYLNLLLEPTINPLKHFPVVTVAAKIFLPLSGRLIVIVAAALAPLGSFLAGAIAGVSVFLLPGVAGFLAWEFKENWKLYRASRAATLQPIAIGHHGETLAGLLKPGFHSGTVPKLYAKLRRAAWRQGKAGARYREALHHVEEAVRRFCERELVSVLTESGVFPPGQLSAGEVEIASNRIRVELCREGQPPAWLSFDEQSEWLMVAVAVPGWTHELPAPQRTALENALAGLYKLASVDSVREQLEHALPDQAAYDVADEGLVVWPGGGYATEVVYDLDRALVATPGQRLSPVVRGEPPAEPPAALDPLEIVFARQTVAWRDWVAAWEKPGDSRLVKDAPLVAS